LPRKLGQHFLYQEAILERIASAACGPRPGLPAAGTVIEIGPGPGTLTAQLLSRCERLIAIELDAELASALRVRYASEPRFQLIEGDVLRQDLRGFAPAIVCGNIPYYITSPIVEKALDMGPGLLLAVFLTQKEVADRIAAQPGSRDYGYLSVFVQAQCAVERLFLVKPASFRPPPKVDSAVIRLTPRATGLGVELAPFRQFASFCFRQKRKNLRNNLSGTVYGARLEGTKEAGLRAEQLSVDDLAGLFLRLKPD
jgi:16S rRNA (adenine1518-N6/adenine1519-N6)-dimethyltransferase